MQPVYCIRKWGGVVNNIRLLVTIALLMSGCAMNGHTNGDVDPELTCGDRTVTVNHARGFLAAHPEYIVVCQGQRILINLVPPVERGSARTTPAEEHAIGSPWLSGENREDRRKIVIQIPAGTVEPGEYKYNITIDGVGTLDPRVRVSRR
jgi:hypothetical protein